MDIFWKQQILKKKSVQRIPKPTITQYGVEHRNLSAQIKRHLCFIWLRTIGNNKAPTC